MSPTKSAVAIIVGIVSLIVAFVNQNFYWRKGAFSGDKPMPRWLVRLMFGVSGLLFMMIGIRDLWRWN
jgi:uncharacterized membrane protein